MTEIGAHPASQVGLHPLPVSLSRLDDRVVPDGGAFLIMGHAALQLRYDQIDEILLAPGGEGITLGSRPQQGGQHQTSRQDGNQKREAQPEEDP